MKLIIKVTLFYIIAFSLHCQGIFADNVGLLVMATGKYISFVTPLIQSAKKHFCKNHHVTFFVFTDGNLPPDDDVVVFYQQKLGWPFDTMMRFQTYASQRDILSQQDYLFACDADMLFVGKVGDEILSQRTVVHHYGPYYFGSPTGNESNPISTAYIGPNEGKYYFAGGFYGGTSEEVLNICETCANNINKDLANNFVAIWHDESHLNRYSIDHPPTLILSPSYCYPEHVNIPFERKLIALNKNHKNMRE